MLVKVYDDDGLIEDCECREVRLPSGESGVVWRGLAYALAKDDTIRIDGYACSPDLCDASSGEAKERQPASLASFAVIDGDDEAYVILQGSVAVAETGTARLKRAGVTVRRFGRYLGDPVDGFNGDWFIRFTKPQEIDWQAVLAETFSVPTESVTRPSSAWELRCRLLEAELAVAKSAVSKVHDRVTSLGLQLAEAEGRSQAEIDYLIEQFAEERRAFAEAAMESQSSLQPTAPRAQGKPRKIKDEVTSVFKALLPRIELVRDAENYIIAELETRTHLYRALSELTISGDRMPPNWKKLQGVPKWWERHVSTGQSDAGRIYARIDQATNRWLVLVSDKGAQSQDIAWLARTA